jgi:hypothetical protein
MKKAKSLFAIAICIAAVSCTKEAGPDIMIDGKPQQQTGASASTGNSSSAYDPNGSSGKQSVATSRGVTMDPDGKN